MLVFTLETEPPVEKRDHSSSCFLFSSLHSASKKSPAATPLLNTAFLVKEVAFFFILLWFGIGLPKLAYSDDQKLRYISTETVPSEEEQLKYKGMWRSHGSTNAGLVAALKNNRIVRSKIVEDAMLLIDRGWFLPGRPPEEQYHDSPQSLTRGATISAPHMHAVMLELMAAMPGGLSSGEPILDIGSGSGILCAVLAEMAGPKTKVIGMEHIPELVEFSKKALSSHHPTDEWMKNGRIQIIQADGRHGYPEGGPYRVIHVGAAAPKIPDDLVHQLAPGGRLVIPVGEDFQELMVIDREKDGNVRVRSEGSVRFVPLTDVGFYQR